MEQLIIMLILIAIIVLFLFYLFLLPAITTIIKMKYYDKVDGSIVDKIIKNIQTPDAGGNFSHYKYQFEYLGKIYQIEDKGYGYNKKLNVGDKVIIYVKRGNPQRYIYPNLVRDRYINLITSALPISILIIIIIIIFNI